MDPLFRESRLIRTEIMILLGLMIQGRVEFSTPTPSIIAGYVFRSYALLEELHRSMIESGKGAIIEHTGQRGGDDPLELAEVLREPIFYGGESAYSFQYLDLAVPKYQADRSWLLTHKNVELEVAHEVCSAVRLHVDKKLTQISPELESEWASAHAILDGFSFSCRDITSFTTHSSDSVAAAIEAFSLPEAEQNSNFRSIHSFNVAYAYPFLRYGSDKYILFQQYTAAEALYDSPYYWMLKDQTYIQTALKHRGDFTESFTADRLRHVFGSDAVLQNVKLRRSKGQILAEIDVLAQFANFAIVVQAKSKKLTQQARAGKRRFLEADFKAAVQDSVDQGLTCAELLLDPSVVLEGDSGEAVVLKERPCKIFPVSVIAEHYPALLLQVRQFLKADVGEAIARPLVVDVFALDSITEMLSSPIGFLDYLERRALFGSKLMANHERVLLACHLRYNTWLDDDRDLAILGDDLASYLDVAMAVRRDGVPGERIPEGMLTCFVGTPLGKILSELENEPSIQTVELGFLLLKLSERAAKAINARIDQIISKTKLDGDLHDITMPSIGSAVGLTVHSSNMGVEQAFAWLEWHCKKRKVHHESERWYGFSFDTSGLVNCKVVLS